MIGNRLKELRLNKGLTQVELASELGICDSTIRMIETNKRGGSRPITQKIANYFSVSIDYLEGQSDAPGVDKLIKSLVDDDIINDDNVINEDIKNLIDKNINNYIKELLKNKKH